MMSSSLASILLNLRGSTQGGESRGPWPGQRYSLSVRGSLMRQAAGDAHPWCGLGARGGAG